MSKAKQRHNPNKPQNKYGSVCPYYEETPHSNHCEGGFGDINICKGNKHNCVKNKYKNLACMSDKQK